MTTTVTDDWRPRPSRIRHSWRCPRTAPVVETVRRDPTGRGWVVEMCSECNGDDLSERMLDRLDPPPDAA